jgi:hypothetical protein
LLAKRHGDEAIWTSRDEPGNQTIH